MNIILAALTLVFCPFISMAGAEQVITLKDGSQIRGELAGVSNGSYTIQTPAMGDVTVSIDQVVSITNPEAMPAAAPLPDPVESAPASAPMAEQIKAAQTQVMSDPDTVAELQEMLKDPEIAQMLSDPALIQAVTAGNPNAVQNNPKAQALMKNPKMRALMEKLQKK